MTVEEIKIGELRVTSHPLKFEQSQPLLPTVGQFLSVAAGEILPLLTSGKLKATDDLMNPVVMGQMAPALGAISTFLDGRLEKLAPKILAATTVVMKNEAGEALNYELIKEKDRNAVFNAHPEAFLLILFHAGRVTFGRFFPAFGPSAEGTPT